MRADFYQLSRDPAEAVLPLLARNTLDAGERLLVVSADDAQLARIGEALWKRLPESFLAHGYAGGPHDALQPILLSDSIAAPNGARFAAFADGVWRDGEPSFARAFLLFGPDRVEAARQCWRELRSRGGIELHYWAQEDGRWREKG